MKEATGELNMTVITVVAIAAIAAIFYAFVWPSIKKSIRTNTCNTQCPAEGTNGGVDSTCVQKCMSENETSLNGGAR